MLVDLQHLRMQFEILNKPLEDIANDAKTTLKAIEDLAKKEMWKQWFPEPDLHIDLRIKQTTDSMEEQSEEFTRRAKMRLQMFNIAKDILMAQKYLALESQIIDKAMAIVDSIEEAKDVKALSALYTEMTKSSLKDALTSVSISQDGLHTVVFKDLSGGGRSQSAD